MVQLTYIFMITLILTIGSALSASDETGTNCIKQCTWNGLPSGYYCSCATTCCAACFGCTIYCCSRSNIGGRYFDVLAQSIGTGKDITPIEYQDVIVKSR
jgi:hypothetical protein